MSEVNAVADIDVVRKGGIPAWVWGLLALLVVVALIAMLVMGGDDGDEIAPRTNSAPAAAPSALQV